PGRDLQLLRVRRSQRLPPRARGPAVSAAARPELSVVVPVFNESESLGDLHHRLTQTLKQLGRPHEIIFVDDGSGDGSADVLRASWAVDRVTSAVVGVRMRDYGCMLRAYRRSVVDQILACQGVSHFIPALANTFATSVAEVPVAHGPRAHGGSRYGLLRLLGLNFDLLTGFSLLPIQVVSLTGALVSILGLGFPSVL